MPVGLQRYQPEIFLGRSVCRIKARHLGRLACSSRPGPISSLTRSCPLADILFRGQFRVHRPRNSDRLTKRAQRGCRRPRRQRQAPLVDALAQVGQGSCSVTVLWRTPLTRSSSHRTRMHSRGPQYFWTKCSTTRSATRWLSKRPATIRVIQPFPINRDRNQHREYTSPTPLAYRHVFAHGVCSFAHCLPTRARNLIRQQ